MSDATKEEKMLPLLAEAGASGLKWWNGYVDDEYHKDLQGSKAAKVYREMMDSHPLIGVGLFVVDMFARRTPVHVVAKDKSWEAVETKELIETALDDVTGGIDSIFAQGITALPFGWAYLEKVFKICRGQNDSKYFRSKYDDGKIRWRKIRICGQESLERWDLDENGEVLGLWQRPAPDYDLRYIPRKKALHVRMFNRKENPEGFSILRPAYQPYYFQKHLQFTEAVGIYRNVAGFPMVEVPLELAASEAGSAERTVYNQYVDMAKKIAADEYTSIVMPTSETPDGKKTGYKFSLVTSSGRNLAETDPIVRRYRTEIAIVMLVQFLLLGEKAGSYNLSENQFELVTLVIEAVIDAVLDSMNSEAVPELCTLNGYTADSAPKLTRGRIAPRDLQKLASFVQAVMGSGAITPDDKLEAHLREEASWPEKDTETERVSDSVIPL